MANIVYIANTNVLELQGLNSAIEGTFINDATVQVTVKDSLGNQVGGQTWPLAMGYVASSEGIYRAILVDGLTLSDEDELTAVIDANGGLNRIGHWEMPLTAAIRTK